MASNIIIIVGGAVVVVKVEHCYYHMINFLIVVTIITFINAIVTFTADTERVFLVCYNHLALRF